MYAFGDSFDLYAAVADAYAGYWDSGSSSSVTLQAGRFAGGQGLQFAGSVVALTKSSGANDAVHHFAVAVKQVTALGGTTLGTWLELLDGSTAQCTVVFRSDGAMLLASGAP